MYLGHKDNCMLDASGGHHSCPGRPKDGGHSHGGRRQIWQLTGRACTDMSNMDGQTCWFHAVPQWLCKRGAKGDGAGVRRGILRSGARPVRSVGDVIQAEDTARKASANDPLEKFCGDNPETDECRYAKSYWEAVDLARRMSVLCNWSCMHRSEKGVVCLAACTRIEKPERIPEALTSSG